MLAPAIVATGEAQSRLSGHEGDITALAVADDGRRAISAADDEIGQLISEAIDKVGKDGVITVEENKASILLVFIDVIEFQGRHIRNFYESMADRFRAVYGPRFEELKRQGRLTDADPMVAVMVATRWLFYFYTVEKCFGVPMHFGMDASQAVDGFIRILRRGLLRDPAEAPAEPAAESANIEKGRT